MNLAFEDHCSRSEIPVSISGAGTFVVSLDYELHWGIFDKYPLDSCRDRLLGARAAIPLILDLFSRFDIGATWATVGLLFFDDKDDLLAHVPSVQPCYENPALSAYNQLDSVGRNESEDPYHFGLSLIRQIAAVPKQEIASHTFSHYYCLEQGHTEEAFAADLDAARSAAARADIPLDSLVFPRNQFNPKCLLICRSKGIKVVRANSPSWMYAPSSRRGDRLSKRMSRLIDAYLPISGAQGVRIEKDSDGVIQVPASRFLRPVSTSLASIETLRLDRIKKSMTQAAEKGQIYHLWWHPHNFGRQTEANLSFLTSILEHYRRLAETLGMRSASMREAAGI